MPPPAMFYTIRVRGSTNAGETFLSATADGAIDLYNVVAGDRQRWVLEPQSGGAYYLIRVYGGTNVRLQGLNAR